MPHAHGHTDATHARTRTRACTANAEIPRRGVHAETKDRADAPTFDRFDALSRAAHLVAHYCMSESIAPQSDLRCRFCLGYVSLRSSYFTLQATGSYLQIGDFTGSRKVKKMRSFAPALTIPILQYGHHSCLAFNHDDFRTTVVYKPDRVLKAEPDASDR